MDNPIVKFEEWWQSALTDSPLQQKSAVCISTVDKNGVPAGRFVDLKSVSQKGFIFCTYLDSAKGMHITDNSNVAMTIWWDHVGYQIRIVGEAEVISEEEALEYWKQRSRSAQLTTTAFDQSQPMAAEEELETKVLSVSEEHSEQPIPMPKNWGGYCVKPNSIEFLTFRKTRLHLRELYQASSDGWEKTLLQP